MYKADHCIRKKLVSKFKKAASQWTPRWLIKLNVKCPEVYNTELRNTQTLASFIFFHFQQMHIIEITLEMAFSIHSHTGCFRKGTFTWNTSPFQSPPQGTSAWVSLLTCALLLRVSHSLLHQLSYQIRHETRTLISPIAGMYQWGRQANASDFFYSCYITREWNVRAVETPSLLVPSKLIWLPLILRLAPHLQLCLAIE